MNLQDIAVLPAVRGLGSFAKLERVLAMTLVLTPALLMLVDEQPGGPRNSISEYHDVGRPEAFYVPLTVAAMLFVVNGVLKDGHAYNWVLGILLFLVVCFDNDGASKWLHFAAAGGFFVGSVVVMVFFSRNKSRTLMLGLAGTIVVALLLWLLTDWFTLFWAEWVSLGIIATHYVLDSVEWSPYRAARAAKA